MQLPKARRLQKIRADLNQAPGGKLSLHSKLTMTGPIKVLNRAGNTCPEPYPLSTCLQGLLSQFLHVLVTLKRGIRFTNETKQ
jgi:hypothetical protein